jgi:hypothetical protein
MAQYPNHRTTGTPKAFAYEELLHGLPSAQGPEKDEPDGPGGTRINDGFKSLTKPELVAEAQIRGLLAEPLSDKDSGKFTINDLREMIRYEEKIKGSKKAELVAEAESRGLVFPRNATVDTLKKKIHVDEKQKIEQRREDARNFLPLEDLSSWGIRRSTKYLLNLTGDAELSPLHIYTWAILLSPYNPAYWTSRAYLYYQMGHPDLAVGDAYRARLLCEVLSNPHQRNRQPGLYIRIWDAIERHVLYAACRDSKPLTEAAVNLLRGPNGINSFIPAVRKSVHHIIALSLLAMQCWRDYQATEPHLTTRLVMPDADAMAIKRREQGLKEFIDSVLESEASDAELFYFEQRYGYVSGRRYPHIPEDTDRVNPKFVERINHDVLGKNLARKIYPRKIEVRSVELSGIRQLGVWATENIEVGEIVYSDEPSLRGHLQVRDFGCPDSYTCENCKRNLGDPGPDIRGGAPRVALCGCSELEEPIYWCASRPERETAEHNRNGAASADDKGGKANKRAREDIPDENERTAKRQRTENPISCLDIAQSLYHHRVCGKDWKWLYDAARPNISKGDGIEYSGPFFSHSNEPHGTILNVLLREVFDITLHRQANQGRPNLLPHEIDELMPLTGAEDQPEQNFPFSFAANVKVPFDTLSYLGVNIFRDLRFDTWVIQLVLRKLLVNAIPWDMDRRRDFDDVKTKKSQIDEGKELNDWAFNDIMPDFNDLYIFPGAAMFNHCCHDEHNVTWQWDEEIPNRLLLRADTAIEAGEELRIMYSPSRLQPSQQNKLLGGPCFCPVCDGRSGSMTPGGGEAIYGDETSADEGQDDEWARGRRVSVSSGWTGGSPVRAYQPPPQAHNGVASGNPNRGGGKGPRVYERGKIMSASELPDVAEEDEEEETSEEEEQEQSESESDGEMDGDDEDYVE